MKTYKNYLIIFITFIFIFIFLSCISSYIPQNNVKNNMLVSAYYFKNFEKNYVTVGRNNIKDIYADAVSLNLAYQNGKFHNIESIMLSPFYVNLNYMPDMIKDSVVDQIKDDKLGNYNYFRYWHGYILFIRLAHLFMDVQGLYLINFILILFLLFILICSLYYKGYKYEALILLVSFITIRFYNIYVSLEYTWIFILNLILCLILIYSKIRSWDKFNKFIFISGMFTCYLDFLTCEIVNLFIPLLIFLILIDYKDLSYINIIKSNLIWLCGYGFTFLAKWFIIFILFGFDNVVYLIKNITKRTIGNPNIDLNISTIEKIFYMYFYNFRFLNYIAIIMLILITLFLLYSIKKCNLSNKIKFLYLISLTPYLRYLLLLNHSLGHYFFTYRIQIITIFAVLLMSKDMFYSILSRIGKKHE